MSMCSDLGAFNQKRIWFILSLGTHHLPLIPLIALYAFLLMGLLVSLHLSSLLC